MAYKINNIENVEGEYHLMFFEGKNMVNSAKTEMHHAWFMFLVFCVIVALCIVISGFNLYYVGFLGVFLIGFIAIAIYLKREKKRGIKQCAYAVKNSKSTDIVAKQVDNRKRNRVFVNSLSGTIDNYDLQKKYPNFRAKLKRKHKRDKIVDIISQFEIEDEKRKK